MRVFSVASTDTGHTGKAPFDFSFMKDEQAMLDFAYHADPRVAKIASKSSRAGVSQLTWKKPRGPQNLAQRSLRAGFQGGRMAWA
jgi:hypothetical protein